MEGSLPRSVLLCRIKPKMSICGCHWQLYLYILQLFLHPRFLRDYSLYFSIICLWWVAETFWCHRHYCHHHHHCHHRHRPCNQRNDDWTGNVFSRTISLWQNCTSGFPEMIWFLFIFQVGLKTIQRHLGPLWSIPLHDMCIDMWGEVYRRGKCTWIWYWILQQIYLIFLIYCSDQKFSGYNTRTKKRICLFLPYR